MNDKLSERLSIHTINHIIDLLREESLTGLNLNRLLGYVGRELGTDWVGIFEYVEYPFRAKMVTSWHVSLKHIWPKKEVSAICEDNDVVTSLINSQELVFIGERISIPQRLIKSLVSHKISKTVVVPIILNQEKNIWGCVVFYCEKVCSMLTPEVTNFLRIFEYLISNAYVKTDSERALKTNLESLQSTEKAILNVLEDAELEKEKSQMLARDLEKFKLAVDGASDHIVITNLDGIILYANKSIENITGYSVEEAIGNNPGKLWGGQMSIEFYKAFWNTILIEKKLFIGEFTNKRKNGQLYSAEVHVTPIFDAAGNVIFFVGIERDITRAKEVDRMKTEFISLASHQLRTPLSAIKWYVEMLLAGDGGILNDTQRDFVESVSKSTIRMIDLVNGLLNISRIESGRIIIDPKKVVLKDLIMGVRDDIQVKLKEKNIKLILDMHQDFPKVNLDAKLIRNVFINLITNSIKYSPPNTTIIVIASKKNDDVIVQISDEGYGIPEEEQSKVFQKFFRAGNAVKIDTDGNGLGLYLVKSIIDSSGGKIWFKSKVDQGSSFWFSLPIHGVPAKQGEVTLDS